MFSVFSEDARGEATRAAHERRAFGGVFTPVQGRGQSGRERVKTPREPRVG